MSCALAWAIACGAAGLDARPARAELFDEKTAVTLFAFDDVSIPYTQHLKLEMRAPERHPANPIVRRGNAGAPDSWAVQFYGSVIRDGGRFRMWYVAAGDDRLDPDTPRSAPWRVAYAESDDGVRWRKPELGLVEYNGSRANNLVLMTPRLGTINLKVLFEPGEADDSRRYKMGAHVWFPKNGSRLGTLAPYGSPDGFRWKLLAPATPVDAELPAHQTVLPPLHFEPVGGLYRWGGLYHLSGQNAIAATRPYQGRVVRGFVSPDFVNWAPTSAIGFVRSSQHVPLGPGRSREGEQTHEGISVWNRGNVLIGLSGMWHGGKQWSDVTIDLGLVVSNDGVRFREPAHERVFLRRGADGQWDQGGLLQGQGFHNVGGKTYIYYGAWDPRRWQESPPRGGVGLAMLPRDRFAHLRVDGASQGEGTYQLTDPVSSLMTRPLDVAELATRRFYVNAEGLGDQASLKVELLDGQTRPIPRFAGDNAAVVRVNGFQTPIQWRRRLADWPSHVRLRVTFQGRQKADIRCCALYAQ